MSVTYQPDVVLDISKARRPRLIVMVPPDEEDSIRDVLERLAQSDMTISIQAIILEALRTAAQQSYFWTSEWQAKEREADQAIAEGRVKTFETIEDMIDFLDQQ
jgi:hypothetical protein